MTYRPHQFSYMMSPVSKFIPIASVNYDFIPTEMGGMPKVWWVDLPAPAPSQLKIGMHTIVRVSYITSMFVREALHNKLFEIGDIIGTRVMLVSASPDRTLAGHLHKEIAAYLGNNSGYPSYKTSPFGWGVTTTYPTAPYKPDQFQIKYGVGPPLGFLEMI